jgi:hypothetical protein
MGFRKAVAQGGKKKIFAVQGLFSLESAGLSERLYAETHNFSLLFLI